MTIQPFEFNAANPPRRVNDQWLYRFENGYGASVIRGPYSYGGDRGLFELAVVTFDGDAYKLCYDTPITDDVEGYLTESGVQMLLEQIRALPWDGVIDVDASVVPDTKHLGN